MTFRNRLEACFLGALALLALVPRSSRGQDVIPYCEEAFALDAGPTLVDASGWDKLAAKAALVVCGTGHGGSGTVDSTTLEPCVEPPPAGAPADAAADDGSGFPFSWGAHVDASYLLASRDIGIPDASAIKAAGGLSVSLSKPERRAPCDLPPPQLLTWDGGGFNLGFVDLGVTVGYESSADRREQHVTAGVEARYALNAASPWGRLVPSIVARFELVDPVSSAERDGLGLPLDHHERWSVLAYWNTSLGFVAESLRPLRIRVDASQFWAQGLKQGLFDAGWEDGTFAGATLSWVPTGLRARWVRVSAVFVRYSLGQPPTNREDRDAFSAGVTVGVR